MIGSSLLFDISRHTGYNMRARLKDNEEEIEPWRRALIDDIKRRSQAECEVIELFAIEWEVI